MNVFLQGSNINRPSSGASTTQARAKSASTRTRKDSSNGIELTINDILHPEHAHLRQDTNTVCKMITIYTKNLIRSIPILNTFPCHVSFIWVNKYIFVILWAGLLRTVQVGQGEYQAPVPQSTGLWRPRQIQTRCKWLTISIY